MTDRVGQHFGNYQLVKLLGQGGSAKVYLGKHRYLNSYAALKVLNATIHPGSEHKFLTEAQTLVDLRHPNIVHLLDFGIEGGTPVLIMDYAPNGSLRQYCPQGIQMPLATIVDVVMQVAGALQYAHNHHVIHRDVKPENILLDADNRLLLSDFGLSLLTPSPHELSTQDSAGTPLYMAPEQLRGKPCFASDQYALAVMVYEWLCGESLFRGNMWEVWHQHLHTAPSPLRAIRPELPPMLEDIVLRALAKEPQDRFVSILAFAQAFARASQLPAPVSQDDSQATDQLPRVTGSASITTLHHPVARSSGNDQIAQRPTIAPADIPPTLPPVTTLQRQNCMQLLRRVRSFWITGVLEQSLHGAALMGLGLQEQPDAVANPWQLIIQESEHVSTPLPTGTRITAVYDQAGGELLILGEPGAGKTTLLLELARDLLDRAEREPTHPIPVVFNLSAWVRKRQPLAAWLIEELETKYRIPGKVGADWINTDQILPLLDGLDEVDGVYRTACMQAIDDYHQAHSLVPLVVCCRVNDYMSQTNRLALDRAVTIQPLVTEQVNEYLARIGEPVASLRHALEHDPVLRELATTPLMLTILILAYQGSSLQEIAGGVSVNVRQQQVFAMYTQRMLRRRSAKSPYSPEQIIHWLSYLAGQMQQQSQTVFYVERMQPDWLPKRWQRRLYAGLIAGSITGLLVGIAFLYTLPSFLLPVLMAMLIVGLLSGWLGEPEMEAKGTQFIERIGIRIRRRLSAVLKRRVMVGVITGLAAGICTALYSYAIDYPSGLLGSRVAFALTYGLLNGMGVGLSLGLALRLERSIEPTEALNWSWIGIRRNIVRWFLTSMGVGLIVGVIFVVPLIARDQGLWLAVLPVIALWVGFDLVFILALVYGVTRGLSKRVLDTQHIVTPNQGIWRSLRYGAMMAIITGAIFALFSGGSDFMHAFLVPVDTVAGFSQPSATDYSLVSRMSHLLGIYPIPAPPGLAFWALDALHIGLVNGLVLGLATGLYCGGAAYVQHFVLRFMLWRVRCVPFNYPHFLDYAAKRILLRKVGGGYIFIHRLLLEYFSSLETQQVPRKPDKSQHKAGSESISVKYI